MKEEQVHGYPPLPVSRKQGSETVHDAGQQYDATTLDFWRWSVSDLVSNATRGILAEFLVASALGQTQGVRDEWDPYDLKTEQGVKVEVKSAAYLQSWSQPRLSAIRFGIGPSQFWDKTIGKFKEGRYRQSDVYVFCLLHHKDKPSVDPLNLAQWTFYVVATSTLNAKFAEQKTVGLNRLLKVQYSDATYDTLPAAIDEAARTAAT